MTDPGLFAAISPSAGWVSFWSYGAGNLKSGRDPVEDLFRRATNMSDTLSLIENLRGMPIFIIHGGNDNNVPPTEARKMVERLEEFHDDFIYREFPGKGHWWGLSDTPFTDCVDLAELWEYAFPRERNRFPTEVSFSTMNPGASHRRDWLEILAQDRLHERSGARAKIDVSRRWVEMQTENALAIGIDLRGHLLPGPIEVRIDEEVLKIDWAGEASISLSRQRGDSWRVGPPPGAPNGKRPGRHGPFKQVFARRFVMIVGTGGSEAENLAALRRARLDSQVWWYRANGLATMIRDTDFDPERYAGRNWIFYGHAGMNAALARYASEIPVLPDRGVVRIGERVLEGPRLACLAVAPHPEDADGLIGIVGGSDAEGIALSGLTSIIRSGIGYPDFCVWSDEVLRKGLGGVQSAGFLDLTWKVDPEDTVFR
ncbi:MAG: prolyl oligopeptidase family serine peptidase [Planctomycetota bacterium]|nr:prolyl oligopeptidase family serine peptidase [Planctomycetota bacterium]